LWGADARVTNDALNQPAYQRVAAATDYDTAGFLPYLEFNGSTWSMSTSAIDFSATDKMTVFAGVRKLSDADYDTILEFSATTNSNAGSFALFAPDAGGAGPYNNYTFISCGTGFNARKYTTYVAPITNVLAASLSSVAANSADAIPLVNVNGSVNAGAQASTNASTGNYGNHSLFIGARNNASLWFTGRLYSLIVRGAASSAAEIAATESWVNGKTAAF
jgi:hypothetical protein